MDAQYVQPTFYDDAVDPSDLFPAAQSLSADCLSDDIASYFSFDDTIGHGSGATTPNEYYPTSAQDGGVMAGEAEDSEMEQPGEVKAAAVMEAVNVKAETKKTGSGNGKPKRKYSASVTEEMAEIAVVVTATPTPALQPAVETKASKRAKKLTQINVVAAAAALSSPPSSPFPLSPSFSSGSVSPVPSLSSASSSQRSSPSPPSAGLSGVDGMGDVDVGALLAESALKKSRLARKAELARLGRKRKNETIEKYSAQVERLKEEVRQLKAQMDKERKAHKKALKTATESNTQINNKPTTIINEPTIKLEPTTTIPPPPPPAAVVVQQPTASIMAASQSTLVALATFCKQRDIDPHTTTAACSALLGHMQQLAVGCSGGGVEGYRVGLQKAAVVADGVASLVARFFASHSLQWGGVGGGAGGEGVDVTAAWCAMWQQPRGAVTQQQLDELNVWMKTIME